MRLWLVERDYDSRQTVTLVYATTDGERQYRRQASVELLERQPTTAAVDRDDDDVTDVADADDRERYADEASRMAERHDPDDEV